MWWWVLGVGLVASIIWVACEIVIEKMFDNSDLGDSDYGC
jgi:hypothetical protein